MHNKIINKDINYIQISNKLYLCRMIGKQSLHTVVNKFRKRSNHPNSLTITDSERMSYK